MSSTVDLVTDSFADISNKKSETIWQRTRKKLRYVKDVITVEPLISSYVMASLLCGPLLKNLKMEKACKANMGLNDSICEKIIISDFENLTEVNNNVKYLINNMSSWQQPVESVMPLILVLFLGSFSDRRKWRKPFLIMPIFGEFFAVIGCALCVVFMRSWPLEVLGIFQTIVPSLFGGPTMISMAIFAYIADVSTLEMRTLRIAIIQTVLNVVNPLTQLFSAHLLKLVGYSVVLFITGILFMFAFLYGIFCVKEPRTVVAQTNENIICDIFNPKHAVETFNLVLKKSPGSNRPYIWLVLLTLFIFSAVFAGEGNLFFLYAQGEFKWTVVEDSYNNTLVTVVGLIGIAVAVPLFTKVLNLSDTTILLLALLDKILCNLVYQFANTTTLLFVAAVVGCITSVTAVAIRSLATKVVSENDLGKAQSLFGICETIAPAIFVPIYNKAIYENTLTTFPAAFFTFSILLTLLSTVMVSWMLIHERMKKKIQPDQQLEANGEKPIPLDSLDPAQATHL